MHLLIPFACINSSGAHQALQGTTLPHLEKLLSRMSELKTDQGDLQTLSPPHERTHAHLLD